MTARKPTAGAALVAALRAELAAPLEFDARETALLQVAAGLADRLAQVRAILDGEGLIVPGSKGQAVAHPLLATERALGASLERALAGLRLAGTASASPMSVRRSAAARSRWAKTASVRAERRDA